MLQYLLTAIAGIAIGIVAMRLWQGREGEPETQAGATPPPVGQAKPALSPRFWLFGAGAIALAALGVFALRDDQPAGGPTAATQPAGATGQKDLADVDTMIVRLAERLAKNPGDGEGFRMLGWSYLMTGHPEKAIEPYRRALTLLPTNASVHAGYGEALVGVAKGKLTDAARAEFARAVAIDPAEPRARYFLALWDAQNGKERSALDAWIALANSGPADAPWQADVRRKIDATAAKLGVDASSKLTAGLAPGPTGANLDPAAVQAAAALPPQDRQAMVDQMVEGLAAKLKARPADAEGWIKLLRSRMVLGQAEQAGRDLSSARKGVGSDKAALSRIDAAAKDLRVPGA